MNKRKLVIRQQLLEKLIRNNSFWSYNDIQQQDVSDDILIEKVLIDLDIEEINSLFVIYPYKTIREIWRKEILIQEPIYHSLNLLLAFLYFHIKRPEKYIERMYQRHLISLR